MEFRYAFSLFNCQPTVNQAIFRIEMTRFAFILIFTLAVTQGFSQTGRPRTLWFWPGSAVTEKGIAEQFRSLKASGFGGVSINAIYPATDPSHPSIPFMSDEWAAKICYALRVADTLGMEVDLSLVSGWPFGGPTIGPADAAHKIVGLALGTIPGNRPVQQKIVSPDTVTLLALTAFRDGHKPVRLFEQVDEHGILNTRLPAGNWSLYGLLLKPTGQKVKRAGPGGEGLVMDHFNREAVERYLAGFSQVTDSFACLGLRAVFNDSYEVYGADGTADILQEFRERRGYALEDYLDIFLSSFDHPDKLRMLADYRETVAELLLENFLEPWNEWSHSHGVLTREQAHGAPGNILDLYAAADIPETESFGSSDFGIPLVVTDQDFNPNSFGRPDPLVMKFASSAANLSGKKLVSSESATWLANHFKVSLAQVKSQLDELFTAGINQVMLANTTYTPSDVSWPGWLFYASSDFGPFSAFYDYLPEFSKYVTTCQQLLQDATPDGDLLIYFPFYEVISMVKQDMGNLVTFDVHHPEKWLYPFDYGKLAREMLDQGVMFDFISDHQIRTLPPDSKKIILIPDCRILPPATARALLKLAEKGSVILFHNRMPVEVPGYYQVDKRTLELALVNRKLEKMRNQVLIQADLIKPLQDAGVRFEEFGREGLRYIRKRIGDETIYFISNLGNRFTEGWLKPASHGRNAILIDPLTNRSGRMLRDGEGRVFLQLAPGQSCFIRINNPDSLPSEPWNYFKPDPEGGHTIRGPWNLSFSAGGPIVPDPAPSVCSCSWTHLPDTLCRWFSGVGTYETDFVLDDSLCGSREYRLDLGDVREAAEVWINDYPAGTAWSPPFRLTVKPGLLRKGTNHIKIAVTNHSANRIIWMDRNRIPWKDFFFVNIRYSDFNASRWEPLESGLLGTVRLETADQNQENIVSIEKN